jgi:hypothetical protein
MNTFYVAPALREYGSVGELTGVGGGSGTADIWINASGRNAFFEDVDGNIITVPPNTIVRGTGSIVGCQEPVGATEPCVIPHY